MTDFPSESSAWYMDAADGYVPLGQDSGTAYVLVHSRFEDRFEVGWLGVAAFGPDGSVSDLWTGQGYVAPSPGHVVGWRVNQTQRYHVLRPRRAGEGARLLVQNCHRQEHQSVGLLVSEPGEPSLSAVWSAERGIPAGRPGGSAWRLHHSDRYYVAPSSDRNEPTIVIARQHREAGARRSALGVVTLDATKTELVTGWVGSAAVRSRHSALREWLLAPGDRLQMLPPLACGRRAMLAQNRDFDAAGRPRVGVLSCDPEQGGLSSEWSAGATLSASNGALWRLDARDRYTVARTRHYPQRCTVFVQSRSAGAAGRPSLGVVSLDFDGRAFCLETVASGFVPPFRASGPGWLIDPQDEIQPLGEFGPGGTGSILVHRRVRDREERQRVGLLSYDLNERELWTEWVANEELPARQGRSAGWRPDPLDQFHLLPTAGAAGPLRMLVQSRPLRDPDRSCVGVLSYEGSGAGLVTEHIFRDALLPPRRALP